MSDRSNPPFAVQGGEKMLYDVRQGPVALVRDETLFIAYHAAAEDGPSQPRVIAHNLATGDWTASVQLGKSPRYDHHFAPVLWLDGAGGLHGLFNCHGGSGTHVVCPDPNDLTQWTEAPPAAESISYPHVLPMADGRLVLYSRTFGHLGYWSYRVSTDGGYSWDAPCKLVDLDQDPQTDADTWGGSYHSVAASRDRRSLHIAFVYLDERRRRNPLYDRTFKEKRTLNRYHLYYARLDLDSGQLLSVEGEPTRPPLNRAAAEQCKVIDTGWHLTNMPSIWVDPDDQPHFLLPESEDAGPWDCTFYHLCRADGEWIKHAIAPTNSTWSGCLLRGDEWGRLTAWISSGKGDGEVLAYAGGDLEEWRSTDNGGTWTLARKLEPEPGLLYNNPRIAEKPDGRAVDDCLLFFGWEGPGSLCQQPAAGQCRNRGRAFLEALRV